MAPFQLDEPVVTDEQTKLFATYLNTIAAGMVVAGIVAPFAAVIVNKSDPSQPIFFFSIISFFLSIFLHTAAQLVLKALP